MSRRRSERFNIEVVLLSKQVTPDAYGGEGVTKLVEVQRAMANVEYMSGSRLLYYKSIGYTKPVTIRFYDVGIEYDAVEVDGKQVAIKSKKQDDNNLLITIILGDIVDDAI